ncbi:MAG: hypothetical protein WA322_17345 [Pseudolabrys sp.]
MGIIIIAITVTVGGAMVIATAVGDMVNNFRGRRDLSIAVAFFAHDR